MTETKIRPMTLVDYIDPGSGVPVKACSPDNGQTYKIYFTPWGIVWHADDVEVLWNDFLKDKVNTATSVDWDNIQNKPVIPSVEGLVKESELSNYAKLSDIPKLPDTSNFANMADLDKLKATLNSNIDAAKVSYEQIYPTLINGTTGAVNAFLITLSEKVKMLAFWANVTLPTIPSWSQVDIMSFPEMHAQNHITLNQAVIPDSSHSLWSDYTSTNFSLRNQTGTTVSNYSFNFFSCGIFLC